MRNVIYYGAPGVGKTYLLQKLRTEYSEFIINDDKIGDIHRTEGKEWLTVATIIIKNNNKLNSTKITEELSRLEINLGTSVSSILKKYSDKQNPIVGNKEPILFEEIDNMWSVNLDKFKEKEERIYNTYFVKGNNKRYEFITFHQSFAYEDFIEGIKPNIEDGHVGYCIEDGILKRLCKVANEFPHQRYALFIDEINRGNISEIFGEVISLIENDKRKGEKNELRITLPYSKEEFVIPSNVDIYGTMNSCDKSIANIDIALRRRFEFIRLKSESAIIKNVLNNMGIDGNNIDGIDVVKLLETINNRIELLLDDNYQIGHAYFTNVKNFKDIKNIIVKKIIPLLEEYFFDDLEKVQIVLNDLTEDGELDENAIYCHEILESSTLIRYLPDNIIDDKKRFYINEIIEPNSIIKIYE